MHAAKTFLSITQAVIARFSVHNIIQLCVWCDISFASDIKLWLRMLISSFCLPSVVVRFHNIFNTPSVLFIKFCYGATVPQLFHNIKIHLNDE